MKIKIEKIFSKDIKKFKDKELNLKIFNLINEIKDIPNISEIKNIKKLKNSKYAYRIRMGDYRFGIEYYDDYIIFVRFLHRKEIYKYFPK